MILAQSLPSPASDPFPVLAHPLAYPMPYFPTFAGASTTRTRTPTSTATATTRTENATARAATTARARTARTATTRTSTAGLGPLITNARAEPPLLARGTAAVPVLGPR